MMGRCALTVRQQIPLQQTVTTYNFQACRAGKLLRCLQKKKQGRDISCLQHLHNPAQLFQASSTLLIIVTSCFLRDNYRQPESAEPSQQIEEVDMVRHRAL